MRDCGGDEGKTGVGPRSSADECRAGPRNRHRGTRRPARRPISEHRREERRHDQRQRKMIHPVVLFKHFCISESPRYHIVVRTSKEFVSWISWISSGAWVVTGMRRM